MATRKDLLKAQSFISRRMVAAFVDRDPDDPTPPLRRVGVASFVSVLLGVVLLAGTALIGMLRPGSGGDAWQETGVIISDTSAGMLFVYSEDDGSLIPMADVASARLYAAGNDATESPSVVKVSTEALRGAKQQPMHGIPGAPGQLPAAEDTTAAPLRLCSSEPNNMNDRFITLEVDAAATKSDRGAFVVQNPQEDQFLISDGKAHKLWREPGKSSPLVGSLPVVEPGALWVSALPFGEPIEPMKIDFGKIASVDPLGMKQIGRLAVVEEADSDDNRFYVQLDNGLSKISYLDMRLIRARYGAAEPRKISEDDLSSALNKDVAVSGNLDIDPNRPRGPAGYSTLEDASVCATFPTTVDEKVVFSVGGSTPPMGPEQKEPRGSTVDDVSMDPLSGVLLQSDATDEEGAPTFLVVDGMKYSIPDLSSRRALGYGDMTPALVPPQLIFLVPDGLAQGTSLSLEHIVVS